MIFPKPRLRASKTDDRSFWDAAATIMNRGRMRLGKTRKMTDTMDIMNAVEMIEEIKRMPDKEREKVIEFARQRQVGQVRYADEQIFEAAADKVFKSHSELLHKLAQ